MLLQELVREFTPARKLNRFAIQFRFAKLAHLLPEKSGRVLVGFIDRVF